MTGAERPPETEMAKRSANLGRRVKRGVFWTYAEYAVTLGLSFGSLIVLARLLTPEDFGIFAIASLFCSISLLFRLGLGPSIIQSRGLGEGHVEIAWTANVIMSSIAVVILAIAVPFVNALALNAPEANAVCWFLLLTILVDALTSPGVLLNQRYMENSKLFMIGATQPVFRYGISILLAVYFNSYWALAIGFFAGSLARCVMSYAIAFYPVRLHWRTRIFLEMFSFSGWLQLNNLVRWLSRYADSAIVATSFGTATLGLYNRARTLAEIPENFQQVLAVRILFPMFASVQDNPERVTNLLRHAYALVLITSVPLMTLTWSFGDQIVELVLGAKWKGISFTLFLLMSALALQAVNMVATSALRGSGFPREEFFLGLLRVMATLTVLYPLINYMGLDGAALSVLLGSLITSPMALYAVWKRLGIGTSSWLMNIAVGSAGGLLSIIAVAYFFPTGPANMMGLALGVLLQMSVLFGTMLAFAITLKAGPAQLVLEQLPQIIKRLK